MTKCDVCDAELQPEQKTCHVCGSNVEAVASSGPTGATTAPLPLPLPPLPKSPELASPASTSPTGERECPACGQTFGEDFQDEFCPCGTELQPQAASAATSTPGPTALPPIPSSPAASSPPVPAGATRPPVGTICLVVYSDTKPRQPVRYVPVAKDVLLVGRADAIRGDFL